MEKEKDTLIIGDEHIELESIDLVISHLDGDQEGMKC